MKKNILKEAVVVDHKRLPSSKYGNPRFFVVFEGYNESGKYVSIGGKTAMDASIGYCLTNFVGHPWEYVKYHITKAGNVVFDYGEPPQSPNL